ncbi:Annexin [Agrocybe pediades]|nr:Annexin [Agrocybe pediades]
MHQPQLMACKSCLDMIQFMISTPLCVRPRTVSQTRDFVRVMSTITTMNAYQLDALNDYFISRHGMSLVDKIDRVVNGNYGNAIHALALGPLWFDVELAHKALSGLGTNEMLLIEVILGRPAHEIRWLKTAYKMKYGKDLVEEVKSDLGGKTERLFVMALHAQKPADSPSYSYATGIGMDKEKVNSDVEALHHASKKKDEMVFCEILVNRSDAHLGAVAQAFELKYKSLSKVIKKTFSGTLENGLVYIVQGIKPKHDGRGYWRDAKLLEKSMAGLGTKDYQLIYRLIRAHWDPTRMEGVKDAYKRKYKGKTLESRVRGETSGWYKDLLVEIVRKSEKTAYQ